MKNLLLIILAISMSLLSHAQKKTDKRTGYGLHFSINATGVYNINGYFDNVDPVQGYEIGIRYNRKLGILGACNEVNYMNVTYTDPEDTWLLGNFYPGGGQINLNYISDVALLKLYIGGLNVHFGTQASYLIGGTLDGTNMRDDIYYININGVNTWIMNDIDLAIVIGAGLDTKMGLYFSWRSTASITPLMNIDAVNTALAPLGLYADSDYMYRLVTASFSVGYRF
tara:strand:+ start:269 stop:946 length:678 start_codon:yes stop_codon:yes gene_type:complete